jgi:hypothetical protein
MGARTGQPPYINNKSYSGLAQYFDKLVNGPVRMTNREERMRHVYRPGGRARALFPAIPMIALARLRIVFCPTHLILGKALSDILDFL